MNSAKLPGTPSPSEREEHELSHIPLRSWCPHCMRGKTKASPHPESGVEAIKPLVPINCPGNLMGPTWQMKRRVVKATLHS